MCSTIKVYLVEGLHASVMRYRGIDGVLQFEVISPKINGSFKKYTEKC